MTHGAGPPAHTLRIECLNSIHEVDRDRWDAIVRGDPDGTPFHFHAFLAAFEDTHCIGGKTGWQPLYVAAYHPESSALVGLAPAFVKHHSMGEFVYDFAWADAAQRSGIRYYPKLIVAAPFSPVTGRRLFAAREAALHGLGLTQAMVRGALLDGLLAVADGAGLSGVHVLFGLDDELALAQTHGFAIRTACQFHWRNDNYQDFEGFLARFPSKRRNQIRRERRQVEESGIVIEHLRGDAIKDTHRAPTYAFYGATVDRFVYGRRYLTEDFFGRLWSDLKEHVQLTLAWRGSDLVGGAMNIEHGQRRFGRYWGALADVPALHFEVCSYAGIEDCIATGIQRFEAGAGGEQHKLKRGFLPAPVRSAHFVFQQDFQRAIADFCGREGESVEAAIKEMEHDVFAR